MMTELGKLLITVGAVAVIAGTILLLMGKTSLGRLPGDIVVRRENFTFFFPLASSIVISIVLSLILWLIFRLRH